MAEVAHGSKFYIPGDFGGLQSEQEKTTVIGAHVFLVSGAKVFTAFADDLCVSLLSLRYNCRVIAYRGLHLVPDANRMAAPIQDRSGAFYRIAAVGAALFLAMTLL